MQAGRERFFGFCSLGALPPPHWLGGTIRRSARAPMSPRLDWLHYKIGTHQSDGTFHSLCQRSKTTITLRSIQARRIFSVIVIVRYCQNQNVTRSARTRAKTANALGLKMAARSSEVGCDTPQRWHRGASGCTVAAQCRQVSLTKAIFYLMQLSAALSRNSFKEGLTGAALTKVDTRRLAVRTTGAPGQSA
jgi:hypothetical protein